MRFLKIFLWVATFGMACNAWAQEKNSVLVLDSGRAVSLRGLSVVNDKLLWASGSNGTVVRSTDGGAHFEWQQVPGFEKRDFRDIEAFSADTAVVMAIGEPAVLLRTTDGGKHWTTVFTDSTKGMFLDALCFSGNQGVVVGDPIDHQFFIAYTNDGGQTWERLPAAITGTTAAAGEAFFAASGTNIAFTGDTRYPMALVTGGMQSRLIYLSPSGKPAGKAQLMSLTQGKESTGANSIAVSGTSRRVITGGDFTQPTATSGNCIYTTNGGKKWLQPVTPPNGYRSCVIFINKQQLVTCGLTGVDATDDGGRHWYPVSREGFHVVQKAKQGTAVFLAGGRGKIGKWIAK